MPILTANDLAKAFPSVAKDGVDFSALAEQTNAALSSTLFRKALGGETVTEWFRFGDIVGDFLLTNEYPIINVTSIKYDGVEQLLTNFKWGNSRRSIRVKFGFWPGETDIEITYTAGYADPSPERSALKAGAIGIARQILKTTSENESPTLKKIKYRDYEEEYLLEPSQEGGSGRYSDAIEKLIGPYRRRPEL